jgi:tetratricopeptide (TPR) repeat protein
VDEAHLTLEALARLLSGGMTFEELRQKVVPHLLERCPACQENYREILRMQEEVGHWNEEVVVTEGLEAPELWARISSLTYEEQEQQILENPGLQTWGLCQLLLRNSLDFGFEDAATAVNLSNLAVRISLRLGDGYHPEWVQDLRARAFAYLGNARRILGELRSADDAFRFAEDTLVQGTGEPRLHAEILDLKSSLRRAQRRFPEALNLSETALVLYRTSRNLKGVAISLLKKATLLKETGSLGRAITLLRKSMPEIEAAGDPQLHAYARFNLLGCLTLAKRYDEAAALLSEVRQLPTISEHPLNLLRLRWTEANIARGLGRTTEAEDGFHAVQTAFLERSMAYDAALVSLDLALVYLSERRLDELKQLAAELVVLFEARDVQREAMAALYLFQRACDEERLTVQVVGKLAEALRRGRPAPAQG